MFREVFEKGKEWADKFTNVVMNYTEVESKVREATNDDPWGPHGKLMHELARETFSYDGYPELMQMLWRRLFPENLSNWRRIYKGLTLLDFLLRHGSERVIGSVQDHLYDLRTLESYRYLDETGRDQGINVRHKVSSIIDLVGDDSRLREERDKSRSEKSVYQGYTKTDMQFYDYNSSRRDDHYDDSVFTREDCIPHQRRRDVSQIIRSEAPWAPTSPVRKLTIEDLSSGRRLGSFEAWKLGRERSITDDVKDVITDAWSVTKVVTNDFFGKPRVPRPRSCFQFENTEGCISDSFNEHDPNVVSEDTYQFPSEFLDVAEEPSPSNSPSCHPRNDVNRTVKALRRPSGCAEEPPRELQEANNPAPPIIDFADQSTVPVMTTTRPQPPSISGSPLPDPMGDLLDPFAELDHRGKANHSSTNQVDFRPAGYTGAMQPNSAVGQPVKFHQSPAVDFGDFASASFSGLSSTSPTAPAVPFQKMQPGALPTAAPMSPLFHMPAQLPQPSILNPVVVGAVGVQKPPQPVSQPTPATSAKPISVGPTWSNCGSLNINLDMMANPTAFKTTQPTLRELQKNAPSPSTTPTLTAAAVHNSSVAAPMMPAAAWTSPAKASAAPSTQQSPTQGGFADFSAFQ